MRIKQALIFGILAIAAGLQVGAKDLWKSNLRSDFLNNSAIIYAINIRNFNAQDTNGNGIIDFEEGEISGNFINAINRLSELKDSGITALHVLPVTPVGKTKALGTAGSLYAASSFNSINTQLMDYTINMPAEEQFRQFINAAHSKGISVIVDVPACGSYDLFLKRPELFVKDSSGKPVVPSDWTDVRLFDTGDESKLNPDVLNLYKGYVDLMVGLGVDGIRADVAHSKPAKFWKELIDYSRKQNPNLLWLAESSDSWKDPVSDKTVFTPYDKLLKAGFDGYYGSWFNLKNWKTAKELQKHVELNQALSNIIGEKKSVIGSFATHDELSPLLEKGAPYVRMIMWLNATLPINSYYVDGFDTGDKYLYFWANKKARISYTDDEYYFVHRGKLDIFNFSSKPGNKNDRIQEEFVRANNLKSVAEQVYKDGTIKFLNTSSPSVFAYAVTNPQMTILVIGNLDYTQDTEVKIHIPKLKPDTNCLPLVLNNLPNFEKGKITTTLDAGETQVLIFENFTIL